MEAAQSLIQFLTTREWTPYPFVPPLTALALSLWLVPFYGRVLDAKLRKFIENAKRENGEQNPLLDSGKIEGILKARALQTSYLTGLPTFVVSVLATVKSGRPWLLTTVVASIFLLYLLIVPKLFMQDAPDYVSTEHPGWVSEKRRMRGFTYLKFYSILLPLLNLVLIGVIIASLPAKKPNQSEPAGHARESSPEVLK